MLSPDEFFFYAPNRLASHDEALCPLGETTAFFLLFSESYLWTPLLSSNSFIWVSSSPFPHSLGRGLPCIAAGTVKGIRGDCLHFSFSRHPPGLTPFSPLLNNFPLPDTPPFFPPTSFGEAESEEPPFYFSRLPLLRDPPQLDLILFDLPPGRTFSQITEVCFPPIPPLFPAPVRHVPFLSPLSECNPDLKMPAN